MSDRHLREDESAPERTMPQGTQVFGTLLRHEGEDVSWRSLLPWLVGLVIFAILVHLVLWGAFKVLLAREQAKDRLPSPLFAVKQPPPAPRLLPNPIDVQRRGFEPLEGPIQYRLNYQRREDEELTKLGLLDPETKKPRLPDAATQGIVNAADPAGEDAWPPQQGLRELMPSDASGGLRLENRLR